jgi:hypothetical protein
MRRSVPIELPRQRDLEEETTITLLQEQGRQVGALRINSWLNLNLYRSNGSMLSCISPGFINCTNSLDADHRFMVLQESLTVGSV